VPQALQLFGSVCVLTHVPLQQVKPVAHDWPDVPHWHAPPVQVSPVGQVWPHDPQLAGSVPVLLQVPSQHFCPVPVQLVPGWLFALFAYEQVCEVESHVGVLHVWLFGQAGQLIDCPQLLMTVPHLPLQVSVAGWQQLP
jgi:hypothetical protein